ncbi:MAG: hypothetical protein ACON39_07735 [Coraliomargaritaceae bacterium]
MTETWAWISGWAIQPARFQSVLEKALPNTRQLVFHPSPNAVDQILAAKAQKIGGYSLGSLLLLQVLEQLPNSIPVVCLAPILGFCQEDKLGGTTPRESLKKLQSRLTIQPLKAVQLFYRLAQLQDEPTERLPYGQKDLEWGLKILAEETAIERISRAKVDALIGREDPLIHAPTLASYFERSRIVPSLHSYRDLAEYLTPVSS